MTNRWGNSGNSVRLYFWGSKIIADGDYSHEIKRCFLLGRKAMTTLDSILKITDITLPTEVCLVKAMVLPVVMYGCESWTIKKAEHWRIDAFELWCSRIFWESFGLQGDPTSPPQRRSVLSVHWKDWYWSWNSNILATGCKELTPWKRPWCLKRLKTGGKGDSRGWDDWMASQTQCTWVWVNSGSWWWAERPGVLQSMGSQRVRDDWETGLNWTDIGPQNQQATASYARLEMLERGIWTERELMTVLTKQGLAQRVLQSQWSREDWWNELIKAAFPERSTSWLERSSRWFAVLSNLTVH